MHFLFHNKVERTFVFFLGGGGGGEGVIHLGLVIRNSKKWVNCKKINFFLTSHEKFSSGF